MRYSFGSPPLLSQLSAFEGYSQVRLSSRIWREMGGTADIQPEEFKKNLVLYGKILYGSE